MLLTDESKRWIAEQLLNSYPDWRPTDRPAWKRGVLYCKTLCLVRHDRVLNDDPRMCDAAA